MTRKTPAPPPGCSDAERGGAACPGACLVNGSLAIDSFEVIESHDSWVIEQKNYRRLPKTRIFQRRILKSAPKSVGSLNAFN